MTATAASTPGLSRFSTFVVLLVPLVWTFEASAVGPDLGRIAAAFPRASALQVELVMTVPLITAVLFSVISGKLANLIDRKVILIAGLILYGVTGILPAFSTSMNELLILRLLTGVGVGLISPVPNAIITERFSGERQRRMLGMTSSVANVANVLASLVSGALLTYGWQYPFYTFSILFVIAALSVFGIPRAIPGGTTAAAKTETLGGLPPEVYGLFLFMTANFAIQAIITTSLSLFMTSAQIGEPWAIGVALIFPGLACFLLSPFYPEIVRWLKAALIPASFIFYVIGYLMASGARSVLVISIAAFVIGIGNAMLTPHLLALTAGRIRPAQRSIAYGVVTAGIAAGIVLSPFLQSLLATLGGTASLRAIYRLAAATAAAIGVAAFVFACGRGFAVRARR